MMYACGQRDEAERQRRIAEELMVKVEKTVSECIQSNDSLQVTIDSLRLQIEDFESQMNRTKFDDDGIHGDLSEEN